ncbi:hypothetical protein Tco_0286626 [Tanacetum coccineum]
MVDYLEKNDGNADFHQILDFLTSVRSILLSYIEQFWNTASLKTINSEKQIHAKVNGKAVVVSESSVRRDLHLNDEDGTACLTVNEIFENLALMGYETASDKLTFYKGFFSPQWKYLIHTILHCLSSKSTSWDQFSTNLASAIICLAKGQKFNFSKLIFDGGGDNVERAITTAASLDAAQDRDNIVRTQTTAMPNVDILQRMDTSGSPRRQDTMGGAPAQTRSERVLEKPNEPPLSEGHTSGRGEGRMEHQFKLITNVPITPHDSPLLGGYTTGSDEGRLKLQELMAMCTKLSKKVLDLKKKKDAQAMEILRLKKRVKGLERQRKSSTSQSRRRKYRQVKSLDGDLNEHDAFKQGRSNVWKTRRGVE